MTEQYRGTYQQIEFKPMPGKVVVEVIGDSEFLGTSKLIIAPASSENPRTTGRVIAIYEPFMIGDNLDIESSPYVNKGDIIIFGRFTGTDITMGRERKKVIVLKETDILCVVKITEGDEADVLQSVEAER